MRVGNIHYVLELSYGIAIGHRSRTGRIRLLSERGGGRAERTRCATFRIVLLCMYFVCFCVCMGFVWVVQFGCNADGLTTYIHTEAIVLLQRACGGLLLNSEMREFV